MVFYEDPRKLLRARLSHLSAPQCWTSMPYFQLAIHAGHTLTLTMNATLVWLVLLVNGTLVDRLSVESGLFCPGSNSLAQWCSDTHRFTRRPVSAMSNAVSVLRFSYNRYRLIDFSPKHNSIYRSNYKSTLTEDKHDAESVVQCRQNMTRRQHERFRRRRRGRPV